MAIINKTGITTGGTIQAEHVTRAIDALSGGSTDTVVATGSFSGSLTGIATSASFATSASRAVSSSFSTMASFATTAETATTAGSATTASYALNANVGVGFALSGTISGSSNALIDMSLASGGKSGIKIPLSQSASEEGSIYVSGSRLYVYNNGGWRSVNLA